jgi:predicted ATP-dependent endonuclease of OLD family
MHVLIGRNGVGKTTLLNTLVQLIVNSRSSSAKGRLEITDDSSFDSSRVLLPKKYFSSVNSVAFSAFDTFVPPPDQPDRSKGVCYFYIGLKEIDEDTASVRLKREQELKSDFVGSLRVCLSLEVKKRQWLKAIKALEFDTNFAEMKLSRIAADNLASKDVIRYADTLFTKMSSGHKIVLLTITKLVETVEEKSLVLMDEPESHLHPPLLSAFARALSELLLSRNAVALIATHSPVILQEVPRSCVWKIGRYGTVLTADRPDAETFGENVGVLTREVFGLEVTKSGFHDLLEQAVQSGKSFDQVVKAYDGKIGYEGQAILRALTVRKAD